MTQYFFDLRSASNFSRDTDGMQLPDIGAVHDVALEALTDFACDAVTADSADQQFAVEVRNGTGPVLEVRGVFSSIVFRKH